MSPVKSGNYACRNFIPKAAQTIEAGTVDFNGGLWHLYKFSAVFFDFMLLRFALQM